MSAQGEPRRSWRPGALARAALTGLEHLVGGFGTALLALFTLFWLAVTAVLCVAGIGLLLAPSALRLLRVVANRERARLSRWGAEVLEPEPVPARLRDAVRDSAVRRELGWMGIHATLALVVGFLGLMLPLYAIRDTSFPLWWHLVPPDSAGPQIGAWVVHSTAGALGVSALGLCWFALSLLLTPALARLQAWPGHRLLGPDAGTDLSLRVAQLTATRAAALDAHATELRRIERSLHDGTQNRLVAVNVMIGAARRALVRDPASADAFLDRAQNASEEALAELRGVVRSILPPVLATRSLADAVTALAASCPVDCVVDAEVSGRCAASVEATAYFVLAETLTNIARHSGASHAGVALHRRGDRLLLEITDDGAGGADEGEGSGIAGIRRRVDAHDGTFALVSPPGGPTTLTVSLPCGL
jgi:signal transduction histidine kinase